jgi:anti-sigma factor RsiW
MTCDDRQLSISMYLDDALEAASQEEMFSHLATCAGCREFLRRSLDLRAGFAAMAAPEIPASLDRRVKRLFPVRGRAVKGAGERIRSYWSRRLSVPLPSAALIALALITATVISISLWQNPEVVSVPCLPAVDVYAVHPAQSPNSQ